MTPHFYSMALALMLLVSRAAGIPHHALPQGSETGHLAVEAHTDPNLLELRVGARANIVRRDAAEKRQQDDPADVTQDGAVTVVAPVGTSSEQVKLEELTEECMQEEPTAECMEKFGSYGIRKLFTESFENIQKLKQTRNGWMSHPVVQKRRFFDLTLPGSQNSGTYAITVENGPVAAANAPYGLISQNLNLYQQLELGVRVFDIKVGYSAESELVYISHGALMVPISTAMKDIRRYLEEHVREVVVLDVKKDPNGGASHLKALKDEEKAPKRIPGQLVHEAIACVMKEMLVTYTTLNKLPRDQMESENPTVAALTDLGAQVVYFWEGQQVLCTTFQECTLTPGWYPPDRQAGSSLAFGQPFALGTRVNATGAKSHVHTIEPACNAHSEFYTKSDQPEQLLKKIQLFCLDMPGQIANKLPKCFPTGAKIPTEHSPTLWYSIDGWVTPTTEDDKIQTERMRGLKAIYTRGEGFTVKTEAERANYLLMSWFLKKGGQDVFTRPNAIMLEFASSAMMPMIRLIEAMQGRPDCGWAIYCKDSGSCWADTLLGPQDACANEDEVVQKLKNHANGIEDTTTWVLWFTFCVAGIVILCALSAGTKFVLKVWQGPLKPKDAEHIDENTGAEAVADASPAAAAAETASTQDS